MPVFNFFHWTKDLGDTLEATGPIVPVTIGIPAALEEFCAEKGFAIPAPTPGYALIDTGASASAVDEDLVLALGILPLDSIPTDTPHGQGRSFVYPAKVSFPALQIEGYAMNRLIGSKLKWVTVDGKEIIMLLGRDMLKFFLLIYNGKNSDVTLAY